MSSDHVEQQPESDEAPECTQSVVDDDGPNDSRHLESQGVSGAQERIHEAINSTHTISERSSSNLNNPGPTRVPGTYPPEWLPDHETTSCMSCDNLFTLIKRRHHCRSCGKIFCSDCCRQRVKLLYLDKEARVCNNCFTLLNVTLNSTSDDANVLLQPEPTASGSMQSHPDASPRVQGVLKAVRQSTARDSNASSSSSNDNQYNKQVIFADGIRPGTDLFESYPNSHSASSSVEAPSMLSRQSRDTDVSRGKRSRSSKNHENSMKNITVCDELGYLPPVVINKNSNFAKSTAGNSSGSLSGSSLSQLISSQFSKSTTPKRSIQTSMESRNCPLNGVMKFEEISTMIGLDGVITFMLLKDFFLKVKIIQKPCCFDKKFCERLNRGAVNCETMQESKEAHEILPEYWCFASEGLAKFGQNEVLMVIDKGKTDTCISRDVFKVYLTLHELALRRQTIENLGNLLFQDGLFGNKDTAGLIFVKPMDTHCLQNLILPNKSFLVAIVLQRWEVPWSKVFPMRLLLRLGHRFESYPYPLISFKVRDPVYYEVGHTIISILGDFRNYRYSMSHIDGMKVMLDKSSRLVRVELDQSCYQQFNKVLDSLNHEHVLAWSSCPFPEADGHLVCLQNEDSQYETVEFFKKNPDEEASIGLTNRRSEPILGASFIIFSGALKVNQSGQSAKISLVEDGLLVQIRSSTMAALKNAIRYMHQFDIDCESPQDSFNRLEIDWLTSNDGIDSPS